MVGVLSHHSLPFSQATSPSQAQEIVTVRRKRL
jgi:hypothetical protein